MGKGFTIMTGSWLWVAVCVVMPHVSANTIYVDQVSTSNDYTTVEISQEGQNNMVRYSEGGSSNSISIDQKGDNAYVGYTSIWGSGYYWGGDLDGGNNSMMIKQYCNQASCGGDRFEFHIQGNSNNVMFGQGYELTDINDTTFDADSEEHGGHFVRLDIHGSNNNFKGSQRSNNAGHEHSNITNIYGNYNNVFTKQIGNQDKTLNLSIYNDNNQVAMIQKGSASHSATVTITGSYATTFDLTQEGSTAQSYSLSQDCQTVGGCMVSVTQQ